MPQIVDTGILFALADRSDAWHARARKHIAASSDILLAPVTILTEVAYLLRDRIGPDAEASFVASLASGEVAIENLTAADWARARDLMRSYEWLGMVDATVVAVAERLKVGTLATTDRRHFSMVRPAHVDRFTLVP